MKIELSAVGTLITGVIVLFTIIASVLRARKYIEDRIQEALSKDEVIQKLSLLVKPDMIFDEKGSIVADRGASALLQPEGIHVKYEDDTGDSIPSEIRISFLKSIKIAPLLTPLNPDGIFITAKRGKAHDWVYLLEYNMTMAPDDDNYLRMFRLEIL